MVKSLPLGLVFLPLGYLTVLQALAEGLDSNQIAERLHISVLTERNHMRSILTKLGVHSRLQALVFALRYGVVESPQIQP